MQPSAQIMEIARQVQALLSRGNPIPEPIEESRAAREAVIDRIRATEKEIATAASTVEKQRKLFEQEQEKMIKARGAFGAAQATQNAAQRRLSELEKILHVSHGESVVKHAAIRITSTRERLERDVSYGDQILLRKSNSSVFVPPRVKTELVEKIEKSREQLAAVTHAQDGIEHMRYARLAPVELIAQVHELCDAAGVKLDDV